MKTAFHLEETVFDVEKADEKKELRGGRIDLLTCCTHPEPYVAIKVFAKNSQGKVKHRNLFIKDEDLKEFATSLLKLLKSKNPSKIIYRKGRKWE